MIGNETDLHYKVVSLIRRYYPDSILVAGLGENQDTDDKRLNSYKKGYMRGQPDLMVLDYHKDYKGLCIEFKSPTNNYQVSKAQYELMEKYSNNGYKFILSNDYDNSTVEEENGRYISHTIIIPHLRFKTVVLLLVVQTLNSADIHT